MPEIRSMIVAGGILAFSATALCPASAAGLKTLHTFTGGDGSSPYYGLIAGPAGSFYGTTTGGGANGAGTVFQLTPPPKGQTAWTLTTLYAFNYTPDGFFPIGLAIDSAGVLYGNADFGGTFNSTCVSNGNQTGCGTIFKLTPPGAGQTNWTESTLYSFTGAADGYYPYFGVTLDKAGNLYGFTRLGGTVNANCASGCGTVFMLAKPGSGGNWTLATLHSFAGGKDGANPNGAPLFDSKGNIYAVTAGGGDAKPADCDPLGCGSVFILKPPAKGKTAWTKEDIWAFDGADGIIPTGGMTLDTSGNLYGATNEGGNTTICDPGSPYPPGCGVAWELLRPAAGAKKWTYKEVHKFKNSTDGSYPYAGPTADKSVFYLTTSGDEAATFGSIVKLTPPAAGKTLWLEKAVFEFSGDANGSVPIDTLLLRAGRLYGTTVGDGSGPAGNGTIFSYTP